MTSFEFKWSKKNKLDSSKVFTKKKKAIPSQIINEKVTFSKGIERRRHIPQTHFQFKLNDKKSPRFGTDLENTKFIRRKGKKDKRDQGDIQNNIEKLGAKHYSLFSEKYKNVHINANIKGLSIIEKVFSAGKKFSELDIHKHIVANLEKHQFTILTNVQEKSIPIVLSRQNCMIRSQTGSGKTLAYVVPILNILVNISPKIKRTDGIQAVIMVPTRELALQINELFGKLNTFQWIIVGHLCGGENRKTEKDKLRRGVHILIGTPGRLLDHILHTVAFNAKNLRYLVLDEADRLLDMGFKKDVVRLVEEIDNHKKNASYDPLSLLKGQKSPELQNPTDSESKQTILLSATLTKGVAQLADFAMKEHVYVDALDGSMATNPDHLIIPNTVKQEFILTFIKHRLVMLSAFLISKSKLNSKTFVFMATSQMVDFHYELFNKYLLRMPVNKGKLKVGDVLLDESEMYNSDEEEQLLDMQLFKLHGSMNQQERKIVFNGFRKAKKGVLLCTDVAARGIDVLQADCIVQYTGPQSEDDYLHRVGRTGRAGKSGSALIFLTHEEQDYISHLQDHKVFLGEYNTNSILKHFVEFMGACDKEKATLTLQQRYETAISENIDLHKKACFAYSSWSRFYSSFPIKMKMIFDLRKVNVGHYVTSFGLKDTPTSVARIVRGQVSSVQTKKLNTKLANHEDNEDDRKHKQKRSIKSLSLTTSEFSSGLEPAKKKKKKNKGD